MNTKVRIELDPATGLVTATAVTTTQYGPQGKQRDCVTPTDLVLAPGVAKGIAAAIAPVLEAHRKPIENQSRRARAASELAAETRGEFDK